MMLEYTIDNDSATEITSHTPLKTRGKKRKKKSVQQATEVPVQNFKLSGDTYAKRRPKTCNLNASSGRLEFSGKTF